MKEEGAIYTLTCDKCGLPFYSSEAFPLPQLCLKCKPDEGRLLTRTEIDYEIFNTMKTGEYSPIAIAKAQDAKTARHYKARIRELEEAIEDNFPDIKGDYRWQALKQKHLKR